MEGVDGTMKEKKVCEHNALRKKDSSSLEFTAYVCGSCAKLFEVSEHQELPPLEPEPMGYKIPWGLRDRQA